MRKIHVDNNFVRLADSLGFTECVIYEPKPDTVIIYTYWRLAPVVLKLRQGNFGGISIAFFRGDNPELHGLPLTIDSQKIVGSQVKTLENCEGAVNHPSGITLSTPSSPDLPFPDAQSSRLLSPSLSSSFFDNVLTTDKLSSSFFDSFSDTLASKGKSTSNIVADTDSTEEGVDFWDEVIDTNHSFYDVLLVISKAVLEFYSDSREVIYQGIRHNLSFEID
jgi:hypothetical protein